MENSFNTRNITVKVFKQAVAITDTEIRFRLYHDSVSDIVGLWKLD